MRAKIRTEELDSLVIDEHRFKETHLKKAMTGLQFGLWDFDIKLNKIYFSEGYVAILGYSPDEFKHFSDSNNLINLIHPDDKSEFLRLLTGMRNGKTKDFQRTIRALHKQGHYIWLRNTGSIAECDENDTPSLYSGVISNITALKLSEIERENLTQELRNKSWVLGDRLKEQKLLFRIGQIIQNNDSNVDTTLQKLADILSQGMQHSESLVTRITFNGKNYLSPNFKETDWTLKVSFQTHNVEPGSIELFYTLDRPPNAKAIFLLEEYRLMNTIAEMIRVWIEKVMTEKELRDILETLDLEVEKRTKDLESVNAHLQKINEDIKDSISYANRIQKAILPPVELLNETFTEAFIFYKAKDIISGDFYWMHKMEGLIFVACVDCTGHGVPGALMSMIGNQLLDHIITDRKITRPDIILEEMNKAVVRLLQNGYANDQMRDGMDLSLCVINQAQKTLSFAGANNDGYIVQNETLITLEADRNCIGGITILDEKEFDRKKFNYNQGDMLYLFSDGYQDQFGGPDDKKFKRKALLELIMQNHPLPCANQVGIFEEVFENWQGGNVQIDDVTLLGIRL